FLISVSVIVGTIFIWLTDEDMSLKWLMCLLSCIMLFLLCLEIREFFPFHLQEKRKELREEIEIKTSDWMEHTWLPFRKNIKQKEFWILQLWLLGKICSYVALLIFDLISYSIGIFGMAYYLLNDNNRLAVSDIFTVLMTLILVIYLSIFSQLFIRFIRQKITIANFFRNLVDLLIISVILMALTERIEQSGKTIEGLKDFLTMFIQFVNGHMYLFVSGFILSLIGYVTTKLIKKSIEKEIEIDLIPTLSGYDYCVDYGKFEKLLYTNTVHVSIQEFTNKEIKNSIQGEPTRKFIDRQKKVYNFYEVETILRYGIGKLWLEGRNIRQNQTYVYGKNGVLKQISGKNR
ncbi:hypothetical protein, partial [Enterococcus faecium]